MCVHSCWPIYVWPPADVLAVNGVGDAFAFVAPFGDGWYRIPWNRHHQVADTAPVDLSEVRTVTRRALGTDFWDARPPLSVAVPQRQAAGADLSGWTRISGGRCGALSSDRPRWARAAGNTITAAVLRIPPISDRIASSISAIGVRYSAPRGNDPRIGTHAPDVQLGSRLRKTFRPRWTRHVPDHNELTLVRPHGYVGWLGTADRFPALAEEYFRIGTKKLIRNSHDVNSRQPAKSLHLLTLHAARVTSRPSV